MRRRILLGSLGLALGIFASPAAGQNPRPASQPERSAKLGRPVALPEGGSGGDSNITPAGLLAPRPSDIPVPAPMPGGATKPQTPMPLGGSPGGVPPVTSVPLNSLPMNGIPMNGVPMGSSSRIIPNAGPNIVEDRGLGGGAPGTLGFPTPVNGGVYPGATVVPSVGPSNTTSVPGLECPLYGDCDPGVPCEDPVGRVMRPGRWWTGAEYLMWWTQSATVPALVTTSSPAFGGRLGVGDTTTLVGGSFGQTLHHGIRVSAGRWFGDNQCRGIDGRMFFLGSAVSTFTATTATVPLLARPFNNVNPGTPFFGSDSEIIADSLRATGGVQVHLTNTAWGAELNYRRRLIGNPCGPFRLDGLVGYRFMNFSEKLTISENFTTLPGGAGAGLPVASGMVMDSFRTDNHFNGGQIGLASSYQRGRWSVDTRAAIAFGNLSRTLEINGAQSLVLTNGTTVNSSGGLLALPGANIGKFSDDVFSVIPEVGINLGYQLTSRLRIFVGYNFLYMANTLRPGAAIDTNIDAARIPNFLFPATPAPIAGTPHPQPLFRSSDLFIQGISFGLQFNW